MVDETNGTGKDAATSTEAPDATTALLDGDKPLVTPSDAEESKAEQPGDTDWEVRLQEAETKHTKVLEELQHRLDSATGRANKADQQDERLSKMQIDIEESQVTLAGLPNMFKVLAQAIASGDGESAEAALAKTETDNRANREQNLLLSRYAAKSKVFIASIEGLEDRDDRVTAWKAEETRLVNEKSQDMNGFDDLIFGARQAKIDEQLVTKDKEYEATLKQARTKWAEEAGIMDSDSGSGAGSTTGDVPFIQNYGDPDRNVTLEDHKRALKWAHKEGHIK